MKYSKHRILLAVLAAVFLLSPAFVPRVYADADFVIQDGVLLGYYGSDADVSIPNGVVKIADGAFEGCPKLKTLTIPESLAEIQMVYSGFLSSNTQLTDIYVHPDNQYFKSIDGVLFSADMKTLIKCPRMKTPSNGSYIIPNGVEVIERNGFVHCLFSELIIAETVRTINDYAFGGCFYLTSINIPASVEYADSIFNGCFALTEVTVDSGNPYYSAVNGVLLNKDQSRLCYYPEGKTESAYTVPSSVQIISRYALNNRYITSVTLPGGLKIIEILAFANSRITGITIPASVSSIEFAAFGGCPDLTTIQVDPGNDYFTSENGVLYNKNKSVLVAYPSGKNDASFTIPNGVTHIKEGAFYICRHLTGITLPDTLVNIGYMAFYDSVFSSIDIPESVMIIGENAFYSCMQLQSVRIHYNVSNIGANAFYNNHRNLTLTVYEGSCAEEYAQKNGIAYDNSLGAVPVVEITIPDPQFAAAVREIVGKSDDEPLTTRDAAGITRLELRESNISDLTGIEYFTALTFLDCDKNNLAEVDLSYNTLLTELLIGGNQLTELDVSNNPNLEGLTCWQNQLTTLDLTNNTELKWYLVVGGNNLTSLDVGNQPKLMVLLCEHNQLTELDVGNNIELQELDCSYNNIESKDKIIGLDETRTTRMTFYPQKSTALPRITAVTPGPHTASAVNVTIELNRPLISGEVLIVTAYGSDNRLLGFTEMTRTQSDEDTYSVKVDTKSEAAKVKAMIWSGWDTMTPLCEASEAPV